MPLSHLSPVDEPLDDGRDGGQARPIRALILTLAIAIAALAACEAVSPGLFTRTAPAATQQGA